jgi:hypothetical protein
MVKRAALWLAASLCASGSGACSLVRDLDYLGPGDDQPLPDLCPGGGWCALPNTKLHAVCPDDNAEHAYNYTCPDVVLARNSGVYDPQSSRLVIWGAGTGETGHVGNEVYALSVAEGVATRLTDPSSTPVCEPELPDGAPHPRTTYDSLAFVDGKMLAFGADTRCGFFEDAWALDLGTATWSHLAPAGPDGCDDATGGCRPTGIGIMADADPVTGTVLVKDSIRFWRYLPAEDRYELLRQDVYSNYTQTGRVDPDRRRFLWIGCLGDGAGGCIPSLHTASIDAADGYSDHEYADEQSGCEPLMESDAPGLAYDTRRKVFVGWPNAGGTVYTLDPDTMTCTGSTFEGGPPPAARYHVTYGRFRYMPEFDAFVVVNDVDNDAWVLRL